MMQRKAWIGADGHFLPIAAALALLWLGTTIEVRSASEAVKTLRERAAQGQAESGT